MRPWPNRGASGGLAGAVRDKEITNSLTALHTEILTLPEDLVQTVLLNLPLVMSKKLQKLHGIDSASPHGKYLMYLALQCTQFELARTLALLCAAFDIEPQNPRMKKFVLNFAVRPR